MQALLAKIFRASGGFLQWRVLWWAHPKFIVGMTAVVESADGKKVLLQRHRYWKEGCWGLPSGYMNRGEKIEETLAREVKEEVGLVVENVAVARMVTGYKLRVAVLLKARAVEESLKPDGREVLEARFFAKDDLPETLLLEHKKIVEELG